MESKVTLPAGTIIPNHISLILDGNGRWARSKGLPVTKGHEKGAQALLEIIRSTREMGIHTLTVWGFSTENWKRPPAEKKKIFELIKRTIAETLAEAKREKVRFVHLGRKDRLPKYLLAEIVKTEEETKNYTKHTLNVALDYGGRDELLRAVKQIVADKIEPGDITEELFESYLDTADQPYPYPDLFIRTSGEQRTSGFLPWQMVYSEYYFEQNHLPDMTVENLKAAILDYSRRRRRFGGKDKIKHFAFKPEFTAKLELAWWRLGKIPEGTRFADYARNHLSEQYGLSKKLATKAATYFVQAILEGNDKKWERSKKNILGFYKLIKEELKLAFEPKVVASLQVKLWKDLQNEKTVEKAMEAETTARELYAEVYRISLFQAAKLAHLRVLATVERNLALAGMGEHHWGKAEDYLARFYTDLKERVA